jgi:hypothetical protein
MRETWPDIHVTDAANTIDTTIISGMFIVMLFFRLFVDIASAYTLKTQPG